MTKMGVSAYLLVYNYFFINKNYILVTSTHPRCSHAANNSNAHPVILVLS
jgi:hypothetical protein